MYADHSPDIHSTDHWDTVGDLTDMLFPIPAEVPMEVSKEPPQEIKPIEFEEIDTKALDASYNPITKTYDNEIYEKEKDINKELKLTPDQEIWFSIFCNSDSEDYDDTEDDEKELVLTNTEKSDDVMNCSFCDKDFAIKKAFNITLSKVSESEFKCCSLECCRSLSSSKKMLN